MLGFHTGEVQTDATVKNVSDTARWVAVYRGDEGRRPFPLFRDPFAEKLAGERGKAIAANLGYQKIMSWIMTVRTTAIDHLILRMLHDGVKVVVNLGAGLDTRPYRLRELPASLKWIEVDFPEIIAYKNGILHDQKTYCQRETRGMDLADRAQRREFLEKLASQSEGKILVLTEGVIPYLPPTAVKELCEDLRAVKKNLLLGAGLFGARSSGTNAVFLAKKTPGLAFSF